jgi:hypothetical protein
MILAMRYLTHASQLRCCHGGLVILKPPVRRSYFINGHPVLTVEDLEGAQIVGCGQLPPLKPCTCILPGGVLLGIAVGKRVDGLRPVLENVLALTDGAPPGTCSASVVAGSNARTGSAAFGEHAGRPLLSQGPAPSQDGGHGKTTPRKELVIRLRVSCDAVKQFQLAIPVLPREFRVHATAVTADGEEPGKAQPLTVPVDGSVEFHTGLDATKEAWVIVTTHPGHNSSLQLEVQGLPGPYVSAPADLPLPVRGEARAAMWKATYQEMIEAATAPKPAPAVVARANGDSGGGPSLSPPAWTVVRLPVRIGPNARTPELVLTPSYPVLFVLEGLAGPLARHLDKLTDEFLNEELSARRWLAQLCREGVSRNESLQGRLKLWAHNTFDTRVLFDGVSPPVRDAHPEIDLPGSTVADEYLHDVFLKTDQKLWAERWADGRAVADALWQVSAASPQRVEALAAEYRRFLLSSPRVSTFFEVGPKALQPRQREFLQQCHTETQRNPAVRTGDSLLTSGLKYPDLVQEMEPAASPRGLEWLDVLRRVFIYGGPTKAETESKPPGRWVLGEDLFSKVAQVRHLGLALAEAAEAVEPLQSLHSLSLQIAETELRLALELHKDLGRLGAITRGPAMQKLLEQAGQRAIGPITPKRDVRTRRATGLSVPKRYAKRTRGKLRTWIAKLAPGVPRAVAPLVALDAMVRTHTLITEGSADVIKRAELTEDLLYLLKLGMHHFSPHADGGRRLLMLAPELVTPSGVLTLSSRTGKIAGVLRVARRGLFSYWATVLDAVKVGGELEKGNNRRALIRTVALLSPAITRRSPILGLFLFFGSNLLLDFSEPGTDEEQLLDAMRESGFGKRGMVKIPGYVRWLTGDKPAWYIPVQDGDAWDLAYYRWRDPNQEEVLTRLTGFFLCLAWRCQADWIDQSDLFGCPPPRKLQPSTLERSVAGVVIQYLPGRQIFQTSTARLRHQGLPHLPNDLVLTTHTVEDQGRLRILFTVKSGNATADVPVRKPRERAWPAIVKDRGNPIIALFQDKEGDRRVLIIWAFPDARFATSAVFDASVDKPITVLLVPHPVARLGPGEVGSLATGSPRTVYLDVQAEPAGRTEAHETVRCQRRTDSVALPYLQRPDFAGV